VLRTLTLVGAALLLAGCGAGGVVRTGDKDNGKKLFISKCGGCHTLAAAGTQGAIGPNLDDSFARPRKEGFKDSAIADIVAGQIREPGQYSTKPNDPNYLGANMPANLVTGSDVNDVAEFVAANAGAQGFAEQAAVTGTDGKVIFKTKCGGCHTLAAAGTSGTQGPNLDQLKPAFARAKAQVEHGGGIMPAFKGTLTDAQITAVAKFVASQAGK
jgi:cbb3-type cytochrome c oxidase subunit III